MDEEIPIHSLDRFRKQSPFLRLDILSDSDAPVGCGGAVLRWSNPQKNTTFDIFRLFANTQKIAIDSREIGVMSIELTPGSHVLSCEVLHQKSTFPLLMLSMSSRATRVANQPYKLIQPNIKLLTSENDRWLWTANESDGANWRETGYDDSSWQRMVKHSTWKQKAHDYYGQYVFQELEKAGAELIGPPYPWKEYVTYRFRYVFEIPSPHLKSEEE